MLFINDPSQPYLVDFNTYSNTVVPEEQIEPVTMAYHGNSYTGQEVNGWYQWNVSDSTSSENDLFTYLGSVEVGDDDFNYWIGSSSTQEIFDVKRFSKTLGRTLYRSRYFTTMGILSVQENLPSSRPQEVFKKTDFSGPKLKYQSWYWQQDANTLDVIVKRSKIDMTTYNQTLDFNINENNIFIPGIRLPASKDYGFARFRKNNGLWEIDTDYQVNLTRTPNTFVYLDGSSIGSKTFPSNSGIYIPDNATITINGNVSMQSGTSVNLGKDAELNVSSSGNINASETTFKQIAGGTSSSERWKHIKLLSNSNTFTDCTIEGAQKGLYIASSGNVVESSTLEANQTGIYINSGDIYLKGTSVSGRYATGSYGVKVRGSGTLYMSEQSGSIFYPSAIANNDRGIDLSDYGQAVVRHTRFSSNDIHSYITANAAFYAGNYQYSPDEGYNSFIPAAVYDIYKNSSNVTVAKYNWWGSANFPNDNRFYGDVSRFYPVSCDPTTTGQHCEPLMDNPGDCTIFNPCYDDGTSAGYSASPGFNKTVANLAGSKDPTYNEKIKTIFDHVYQHLKDYPSDPHNPSYLRQVYQLLKLYDTNHRIRDRANFAAQLKQWINAYTKIPQSLGSDLTSSETAVVSDSKNSVSPAFAQTAMIILLNENLLKQQFNKTLKWANKFEPFMLEKQFKTSLWSAKAIAYEQRKEFNKALAAYEQIEQIGLSSGNSLEFIAPDYSQIKAELADSMAARKQSKQLPVAGSLLSDVKDDNQTINSFEVGAPYPNPFNPTTTIPFQLPVQSRVTIAVYNMLGRKVSVLTDRLYQSGTYNVQFSADKLSSGTYFIRTSLGGQLQVQKVTLIK